MNVLSGENKEQFFHSYYRTEHRLSVGLSHNVYTVLPRNLSCNWRCWGSALAPNRILNLQLPALLNKRIAKQRPLQSGISSLTVLYSCYSVKLHSQSVRCYFNSSNASRSAAVSMTCWSLTISTSFLRPLGLPIMRTPTSLFSRKNNLR